MKKISKKIFLVLLLIVCVFAIGIYGVWHNEMASVMSIKQLRVRDDAHLDGSLYTMHVSGDFYLDDFVEQGGVSSDRELIAFVTNNITKGLLDINISDPEIGCASFTATSEDGDALFARNYDFSKTNAMIVTTDANKGRHASISTVDLQFLGLDVDSDLDGVMDKITALAATYAPLDGMNDAGVSCGIYMTYQGAETTSTNQNSDKPDLTSTTLLRMILDYADDVEEAVEIAQSYDLHDSAGTSYHYMVADASGKSAILEWCNENDSTDNDGSKRTLHVTYNDDDSSVGSAEAKASYQWVTNFVVKNGYYDGCDESEKKGYDRYLKLQEELEKREGIVADEEEAMEILSMIGRRTWKNDDGNGCTVHSVVYNLSEGSMLFVSNENYDKEDAIIRMQLNR